MDKRKVRFWMAVIFAFVLPTALLLGGCSPRLRVGALQSESQSVELGDAETVRTEIEMGAGDLAVSGGSEKLLEADFTYNVEGEGEGGDGVVLVEHLPLEGGGVK